MNPALPPEFEFLCYLVRPDPDHRRALHIAQHGLDWRSLADLAAAHGVRPHLLHALSDIVWTDRAVDLKQELESFWRGHMVRNLHVARELLRLAEAFDQYGIPFATFKGPALAISLYGDISRREFNDIDIIVHEADVRAAEDVLQSCGYWAAYGSSREYREAFLGYQQQYMFSDSDSVLAIDLHWDFTPKGMPFPLRTSEIWSTLSSVPIAGRAIPVLGLEALALFLAGHGTKEGWKCLGWVCDLTAFCHKHSDLNWNEFWQRLDKKNRGRPILLGLSLAAELLNVASNTKLVEQAERDPKILALRKLAVQRMVHLTRPQSNLDADRLNLALCETRSQKLKTLWVLASTRTTGDYGALPLPRPLWRLYHLTRPFRLAGKLLSVR